MKQKLMTLVLACMFALALPGMAMAADSFASAEATTAYGADSNGNPVSLKFTAEGASWVKIVDTDTRASNYNMDGKTVLAEKSYEITASDENVKVTLVYTTDEKYAGLTCYAFVEHADGTTEVFTLPVDANGQVTLTMDKLSTVTFAISNETYKSSDDSSDKSSSITTKTTKAAASDSSSSSPKTGVVA